VKLIVLRKSWEIRRDNDIDSELANSESNRSIPTRCRPWSLPNCKRLTNDCPERPARVQRCATLSKLFSSLQVDQET
jgi:hypothetical protein